MRFLGSRAALFVRIGCIVSIPLFTFVGVTLYLIGERWGLGFLVFVSVLLCVHWPALIDNIGDDDDDDGSLPVQQQPAPGRASDAEQLGVCCSGLGASVIAALPAYEYDGGDNKSGGGGEDCAVCLGELQRREVVKQLPACLHLFHEGCIDAWLRSNITCPVCRSPVDAAMPVGAQNQIMLRVE